MNIKVPAGGPKKAKSPHKKATHSILPRWATVRRWIVKWSKLQGGTVLVSLLAGTGAGLLTVTIVLPPIPGIAIAQQTEVTRPPGITPNPAQLVAPKREVPAYEAPSAGSTALTVNIYNGSNARQATESEPAGGLQVLKRHRRYSRLAKSPRRGPPCLRRARTRVRLLRSRRSTWLMLQGQARTHRSG